MRKPYSLILSKQLAKPSLLSISLASILASITIAHAEDEPVTKLATLTVYAHQDNTKPASVTKIDRENLDKTGTNSMADIVKYLPLVTAPFSANGASTFYAGSGTSSYNIRGIDGNRVGLDVDGVDIADATIATWTGASMRNSAAGRDYIDPEMFQSVNIYSGTTDVSTDGIGGRVSFINKSPEDYLVDGKTVAGTAKLGYSSADEAWLTSVTSAIGNDTVKALVAYAHRDGHEIQGSSDTKQFPADWKSDAVLGRLIWNINDQHQLGFTVDYYKKNNYITEMDGSTYTAIAYNDGTQDQNIERQQFSIDYIFKPTQFALFDKLKTKTWYQKSNNDTRTTYSTSSYLRDVNNEFEEINTGIKLDADKSLGMHNLTYGLIADQKQYDSNRKELRTTASGTTVSTSNLYQGAYIFNSKVNRYAAYLSDAMKFDVANRELIITPSLRGERSEYRPENSTYTGVKDKNFSYFAPGLSASFQLTPHNYTYAKYTHGARVPSATELGSYFQTSSSVLYYLSGNSDLKKETSDAFEIGLRNDSIEGIKVDVTGFYTKYKNFIDYKQLASSECTVSGVYLCYEAQNLAKAAIWGAELSARIDLGHFINNADGFSLALVAGKTKGNAEDDSGNKTGLNSINPGKASLTFAYDDPNQRFGLGFTTTAVEGKTASQDISTYSVSSGYTPVAGYTIFDFSAYWNINKHAKLNVGLNNIFDKTYWSYSTVGTLNSAVSASGRNTSTLIDRSAEVGRNVTASLEFKF
ncbi:TonB-dependent hemoglobin/transferrin/lactoferrin family receptor [Acinetobacter qingfengensis]|uniref:TonB-dependent receptor n=1 Tax=Acinetobacter qingfengensis TaxID=1262585 RepID=A0A1E7R2R8_9GAMM|nr:TonB-dependent hemoglobin/transferrin/lactoferrin family receptor [Acinetobacter qingfengensis]KAA8735337.1 TonB-dependent hemoglobin/transferrin/lactoferrin family receptor [Acinetobacter qingfengensis]OEY93585.1 TonB-dependent receptor [Acinetobacter qingfengensis]